MLSINVFNQPDTHNERTAQLRHASAAIRRRPASSTTGLRGLRPPHTYHLLLPVSLLPSLVPPAACRLPVCLYLLPPRRLPHFYPLPACTDMAFYSPVKLAVLCSLFQAAAAEGAACRCVFARPVLEL